MALTEEYTKGRLDRLAGDIRDEAASRYEGNRELRSELWEQGSELRSELWEQGSELREKIRDEIREVSKTTSKEIANLWKVLFVIWAILVFTLSVVAGAADAAPLETLPPPG